MMILPTSTSTPAPTAGFGVERAAHGVALHGWKALRALPVDAWVSSREGGVSTGGFSSLNLGLHVGDDPAAVLANRARLAAAAGYEPGDAVFCEQNHGSSVALVDDAHRGLGTLNRDDALRATDAMITRTPGLVLAVMVADCVPIVLLDPVTRTLACVHAGWGGTVRGVTPATVAALRDLGVDPANLVAGIGPSIAPTRYEVGPDVAEAARAAFGDRSGVVLRPTGGPGGHSGRWLFDLWAAAVVQLTAGGVREQNIHVAGCDTGPATPFFSHRSEAPTGRFTLVARLTEASSKEPQ